MTQAEIAAARALREATSALSAGQRAAAGGRIEAYEAPDLARDLSDHLAELVRLMRTVDLTPVPTTSAEQSLHAVSRHIGEAAELAERAAKQGYSFRSPPP